MHVPRPGRHVAVGNGDLSGLGLDKLVVVAFSKDGLHSFDVLTATLETP